MEERRTLYNRFLWMWLIDSVGVWPVAMIACALVWTPILLLGVLFGRGDELPALLEVVTLLAMMILPGMTIGYVVGDLQRNLIRSQLHWYVKDWLRWSVLGGLLGGLLAVVGTWFGAHWFPERVQWMLLMPLYVFGLSLGQWWVLRRLAQESWMWILANVVGGIVFSGLFFLNQSDPGDPYHSLWMLLLWLAAVLAQGVITGIVLLWLYDRPVDQPDNPLDEGDNLARVYVEVRQRDDHWFGL
jgi:hypothetical protein